MPATAHHALFVGTLDWAGPPRLPYYFRRAGARVDALIPASCRRLSASSYVSERIPGSEDPDEALDLLRRLLETGRRYDWIVFCDDVLVDHAVCRRKEAWLAPLLPASPDERADALISKAAFSRTMSASGVPMPPGQRADSPADIVRAAASLGFPVIVKPDRGFAGTGIFSARDDAELAAGAATADGSYLVERCIEGRVGGTPALFRRGRLAWWSSFLKSGVWPAPFGPSCRRSAYEPAGLEAILQRMGAAMELHGLFGVDWIETPDGKVFVIELNGRPIPMNEGARQVREALPAALADFLSGRDDVRPPGEESREAWHMMPQSYELAVAEGDRLLTARLILGMGVRRDIPWNDPGILREYVSVALAAAYRKLFRRG